MSVKSQEQAMRRLAQLLSGNLSYIWGERESGPNGDKKVFLNVGKAFLRTLAKDLGLHDCQVRANAAGIVVSGECYLTGMWESGGIHICIEQPCCKGEDVLLYRTIRNLQDHKGGYNRYIRRRELIHMSYPQLLERLNSLRRETAYERAA